MKMSNSWGKIIFHLNLVFLLAASATDESVNKKNDLNTIKERINSRYYEFFNELYSNRYLIGNCSYEDEDLHGEDLYNTQIESIESYCNKTITANNNNKLLMCEERIDNYLIYLKADLYNMNSCRNKNKTFQEDDYKRMNMSKEFLLKMHDKNSTTLFWITWIKISKSFLIVQRPKSLNSIYWLKTSSNYLPTMQLMTREQTFITIRKFKKNTYLLKTILNTLMSVLI
ncbi:uncharacterized protein LOC122503991 isoform X2 [Leptopilina heterotoma]|uniref:uncharacterized protein LOC122503991 isoform X2 n=1 Tax=Leptopilina heterotoma TaxID=63436 RepID=UPI001CA967A5|nr:uncharacterized protein LOC122503991 isoform X2 [Leptopilina heterotoma]